MLRNRLTWTGHVSRMTPNRLPGSIMHGELVEGSRPRGDSRKRYKDVVKMSLRCIGMKSAAWEEEASDRDQWKRKIYQRMKSFEVQ